MARITQTLLVAGLVLVAATAVGASAFTAATVERQANADVVADENGLLALIDGNSGNLVFQDPSTEQLKIDFENGSATGANTDALFELGDPANPGTSHAFQVKNNDDEAHVINVAYTHNVDDGNSDANLKFQIYKDGSQVGTVTEEGQTASLDAAATDAYDVVVVVDTGHNGAATVTSTDDLSGTLAFTIDDVDEGGSVSDGT
ncbi:hypothetical protein [Halorientalis sp.]|uniref:hypothetical protein n=1 Tax=Halorientalis sp. TaxID=1931229 RepID=UPI00262C8C53|nr:hypothetical protein [Halorientalis sp.]